MAGYCWNWKTVSRNNSKQADIEIGDYKRSMNLKEKIWATDPESIDQIGCIHTSQGLEFDYIGVIIGPDIKYRRGYIITNFTKRAETDFSLRGLKSLNNKDPKKAYKMADKIIKNTYKILMTRGLKGCYIYCTDEELNEYFKLKANESKIIIDD